MSHHRWERTLATVLLAALFLQGCDRGQKSPPPPDPEVATVPVQPQRVVLTTELPGRTSPYLIAQVRPQATGIIQKRLFTEGAVVEAGDVLYEIDPKSYKAAYANAKAVVASAKANYATALAARDVAKASLASAKAAHSRAEATAVPIRLRAQRFSELVASKAVSQQDFDDVSAALKQAEAGIESAAAAVQSAEAGCLQAEALIQAAQAAVETAEAGLATARINLDYTRITAPIAGHIGRSSVTTGALVAAYQPVALATIQQLDPIYVDVVQSVTELQALKRRLAEGRLTHDGENQGKVTILREDGTPYLQEGTLEFRDVTVDPSTGSVILRIVVPNPDGELLPGMFVRAVLKEGVKEDAVLVPQQAVSRTPRGEAFAWIVQPDGTAAMRMLTLDRAIGSQWLVCSGLAVGDRVIVEGVQRLRPGVGVKAVPFNPDGVSGLPPEKAMSPSGPAK
ncbi:MAG: efflux RND transporter periplasmic adaptor subunit [Anaerolineae bacterium]|nr:efflux RND transporter periplasmic adaptor subunit [Anaerolineae bacterium]